MAKQLIDRAGVFRGTIEGWAVTKTRNGFPQFAANFVPQEMYDADEGTWIPWAEYEQESTGYLLLGYKNEKTKGEWVAFGTAKDLMETLGWDGASYKSLAEGDYHNKMIMFGVEENVYNGNTSYRVQWIGPADGSPVRGGGIQCLVGDELDALDAECASILAAPAVKPAKAKRKTKPKSTKKATAAPPAVETSEAEPAEVTEATEGCTELEAWNYCCESPHRPDDFTDEQMTARWQEIVCEHMEKVGLAKSDLLPSDWATIRDGVMNIPF